MMFCVDLDGVSVNLHEALVDAHNEDFGTSLQVADITEWHFLPLTVFNNWDDLWAWAEKRHLFRRARPMPGWSFAITRLCDHDDVHVTFATHRPPQFHDDTLDWLATHGFDDLPVIFTNGAPKSLLDMDLWVDDSPLILAELAEAELPAFRFVRPWNRPIKGVTDCRTWLEVLGQVQKRLR